jgi:urease accessory protein
MGAALIKLLGELDMLDAMAGEALMGAGTMTLPAAFAAARGSHVEAATRDDRLWWSWLENQVLAAMKAVPVGQGGQRLLRVLNADSLRRRCRQNAGR